MPFSWPRGEQRLSVRLQTKIMREEPHPPSMILPLKSRPVMPTLVTPHPNFYLFKLKNVSNQTGLRQHLDFTKVLQYNTLQFTSLCEVVDSKHNQGE